MPRSRSTLLLVLGLLIPALPALAGNNAGGTAGLGWNATGDSTEGAAIAGATFPLYLHLSGVTDVHELAVCVRWVPYDSTGQCYSVLPPQPDSACGWISNDPPGGSFAADSSYAGSIHFPSGLDRNCVLYWVSTATCDSARSAKFIATAYVMDSDGVIDTLRNVANARLFATGDPDTSYLNARRAPPEAESALSIRAMANPTSTSTTIRFSLPGATAFRLAVYDISGRLIRNASVAPDTHGQGQWQWDLRGLDGRRVRAGIYFVRLATRSNSRVLPVTVLK